MKLWFKINAVIGHIDFIFFIVFLFKYELFFVSKYIYIRKSASTWLLFSSVRVVCAVLTYIIMAGVF